MGHMLGDTVMDTLARCHRMRGTATLWVPGLDHAGLATQVAVRNWVEKEGRRWDELSREEALAEIARWKEERERHIRTQAEAGGFSVDWSRYRYTMDAASVRATREAFVALHRAGLVYRGERIVNWDPPMRTAISDLEVQHREEDAELLYVRYPWADGSAGGIEIATVRPETIFGDVAVAVPPDDPRYRDAVGRSVQVPLSDRVVPVIADSAVDPAFGAGALKITPRHDPIDREIFLRHPELPMPPELFDEGAHVIGDWAPAEYRGLDRDAARTAVTRDLERDGFLVRRQPYRHSVARSERSGAVIEPRLSTQWFVKMGPLATPVLAAVRAGEVKIHPARWELTFFRWMEGIQDWCISRQVFWGHPIPVSVCRACGQDTVAVEPPTVCSHCGSSELTPDPDVLDTWFTSWLWPFAALGWPEPTSDLAHYYPNSVLVTARDIMFFWVARMMMAGYYFRGARPFSDVYFTGMLRDETGRKLSKSLGNSPDPLELIRARGADTMRFALLFPNPAEEDGAFGDSALDGARNFLTKVWNLVRFALPHLPTEPAALAAPPRWDAGAALENRWLLARYRRMAEQVDAAIEQLEPSRAASVLHGFLWHDLADRYVEIAKDALQGRRGEPARREASEVLGFVLERTLRRLHPIVPHVTEELWHALPHDGDLLATASWPAPSEAPEDPVAELEMEPVLEAIRLLRNLRAEERVPSTATPAAWVRPAGAEIATVLRREAPTIQRLTRVGSLTLLEPGAPAPAGAGSRVAPLGECYLERPPSAPAATAALERERSMLADLLAKTRARLADDGFRARAPPEVVREAEEKLRDLTERIRRIDDHLKADASPSADPA